MSRNIYDLIPKKIKYIGNNLIPVTVTRDKNGKKDTKPAKWGNGETYKTFTRNSVAMVTGNGIAVVDVDTKEIDKLSEPWGTLVRKWLDAPATLTIETYNGYHFYFDVGESKVKSTTKEGANKSLVPYIDFRGEGGLIFVASKAKNVSYKMLHDVAPAKADQALLDLMPKADAPIVAQNTLVDDMLELSKEANNTHYSPREVLKMLNATSAEYKGREWLLSMVASANALLSKEDRAEKVSKEGKKYYHLIRIIAKWTKEKWPEKMDKRVLNKILEEVISGKFGAGFNGGTLIREAKEGGYGLRYNQYGFTYPDKIIDDERLRHIQSNVFFNDEKNKFYMIDRHGKLTKCPERHFWDFVGRTFPPAFNLAKIDNEVKRRGLKGNDAKKFTESILSAIEARETALIRDIRYDSQFSDIDVRINPFETKPSAKLTGSTLRVILTNLFVNIDEKSLEYDEKKTDEVFAHFKKHFKQFQEVLDLIVAVRFGGDRKKAYLYTQMVSDFGKSFLASIFEDLGLLVHLKESEIKKAASGDPVGMDAGLFSTAWIIFFDEFKSAIGELKDITHVMRINPKNQLRQTVQLYTKWAASAEDPVSLTGNGGVDDQFANRFSMIDTGGETLTSKELYADNQMMYKKALTYAIYRYIKAESAKYIAMGEAKAALAANEVVNSFRTNYKMEATLTANTEETVDEILKFVHETWQKDEKCMGVNYKTDLEKRALEVFVIHDNDVCLRKPAQCDNFYKRYILDKIGDDGWSKRKYKAQLLRNRFVGKEGRTRAKINGLKINFYPQIEL